MDVPLLTLENFLKQKLELTVVGAEVDEACLSDPVERLGVCVNQWKLDPNKLTNLLNGSVDRERERDWVRQQSCHQTNLTTLLLTLLKTEKGFCWNELIIVTAISSHNGQH